MTSMLSVCHGCVVMTNMLSMIHSCVVMTNMHLWISRGKKLSRQFGSGRDTIITLRAGNFYTITLKRG